ncbi:MAG: lysylphosphatidylglycerol synthase transmembrane domain-containing protein [Planctomycetaceae bacterium]
MTDAPKFSNRTWYWPIFKWGLCLAILIFVGIRASQLWQDDELREVSFHFGWLGLAMVVYLLSWIPSAWYWQRLLLAMGQSAHFKNILPAYYCGHLGKYIPGKAVVLVIRAGMLKNCGHPASVSAITATFETLLMMGTGLAVGLALFPITEWPPGIADWISPGWLMPFVVIVGVLVALPIISALLTRFAIIMTPKTIASPGNEKPAILISKRLIFTGLGVFLVSWILLGLSLGLTLQGVSGEPFDVGHWPIWTGAVSLATAIGFAAVFAPGGVGVREGLLIEILRIQPGIGERQAVVASVLLRLIWLVAEILAASALYWSYRRSTSLTRESQTSS